MISPSNQIPNFSFPFPQAFTTKKKLWPNAFEKTIREIDLENKHECLKALFG